MSDTQDLISLTAGIAAAYVANNHVAAADVPQLLTTLHGALSELQDGRTPAAVATPEPATERPSLSAIRKSIRPDGLVSFIDGGSYKTLKRHLTKHGLDPQSYRDRFGLPSDYPMTCPAYSAQRSSLAKAIGLGGSALPAQRQAAE